MGCGQRLAGEAEFVLILALGDSWLDRWLFLVHFFPAASLVLAADFIGLLYALEDRVQLQSCIARRALLSSKSCI